MALEKQIIRRRTKEELLSRNDLQRQLLQKCIEEGLCQKTDTQKMTEIFALVSEVIDAGEDSDYAEVVKAFKNGDYDFVLRAIMEILKNQEEE